MSVFAIQTEPEKKKRLLFRIYDKENRRNIPLLEIRGIMTDTLFVRSHYSEVSPTLQVKSSYSDKVMRGVMEEFMLKYDRDTSKTIDYEEFKEIVTDADVDQLFSLY